MACHIALQKNAQSSKILMGNFSFKTSNTQPLISTQSSDTSDLQEPFRKLKTFKSDDFQSF